ncbi:helix-hairpin-helix domain-containing protein [Heyndrickxia ginsengihumi]|uniref:helix-hairpin-helix domain-containing protein n=1 Tax=Heyndrickxia ginsengihumi TaxID=363870 RepID=UPI002040CBAB|nr:helix-hairpin-helix domain-containing protein [Heyndrickxia ginsengihumi]MCM3021792.1 helix-hairpin-helix domain-containing protein [Heyndrickxia ginsengihumi]
MKDFLLRKYWMMFIAVGVILAIFLVISQNKDKEVTGQAIHLSETKKSDDYNEISSSGDESNTADQSATENQDIYVDVKGAVNNPGVYKLSGNERVQDAIQDAGGFKKDADQNQVNLAQKVQDEMVVYVPEVGENQLPTVNSASSSSAAEQGESSLQSSNNLVNINTADETELQTLTGIGPSKAAAIIEYREKNGFFKKVEDLKNVSGIGDKTFEKIQSSITVQ